MSIWAVAPWRCCAASLAALVIWAPCTCASAQSAAAKSASKNPLRIIKAEDAKDYDGKEVTVEFKVVASYEAADTGVCFLNSLTERDDPKRFTAFISHDALVKFRQNSKTQKPADYFKNKTIRVTGTIKLYKKQYEIEVSSPAQIRLVEEDKESGSPG